MNTSGKTGKHTPSKIKGKRAEAAPPTAYKTPAKKKARQGAAYNLAAGARMSPSIRSSAQRSSHAGAFWTYVDQQEKMSESDRIASIRNGLPIVLPAGLRDALDIQFSIVAKLLNTSTSTLERRMKKSEPLDQVASERLDRIAQITNMAEDVLERREEASKWLTRAHPALNQQTPISLCDTEIGARQVRRILSAMEWGNAA